MANQPYLRLNLVSATPGRLTSAAELSAAIGQQLRQERVAAGCRLPPVRVLAHQLGISKNTVQSAYDELVAQGRVESRARLGLFVAVADSPPPVRADRSVPVPELIASPLSRPQAQANRGTAALINISSVFIDPELLPKSRIAACFRSVLKQPGWPTPYYEAQGFRPLREKIAERLKKRGIQAEAAHIVTTVGSQQALDLVCRSLARKKVGLENPAYGLGMQLMKMSGVSPVGLPLDPFAGPDLKVWRSQLRRHRPSLVFLTTNFHNPTGYSYSSAELDQILGLSQEFGFGILEDDWGSDMLSFSEFKPSLRARGGDHVFYANSFTKKLLPSLRLGYLAGNALTTPLLTQIKTLSCLGLSPIIEAVLFEFLDRGYYDAHLKMLQAELDQRYRSCLEALRQAMPEEVKWTTPGGGPGVWVEVPKRVNLDRLQASMAGKGYLLGTMNDWFFGPPHLNGFRLGYALLPQRVMHTGIEVLAELLRQELA